MGTLVAAAKALPLVLLALFNHHLLFKNADTLLPLIGQGCPQVATYPWRSGIEAVDNLLCILVLFFKSALSTPDGYLVTGYIMTTLNSVFTFMAVEGSRYGSGWLLSLLPVHALLFQLKGISVEVPLVWLPLYLLYRGDDRSKYSKSQGKVSVCRVMAILLGLLVLQFTVVGVMLPLEDSLRERFIFAFQFAPLLVPVLWLPFRTTEKTRQVGGHKAIIALHLLQAGIGMLWQLVALVSLVGDPRLPSRVFHALLMADSNPSTWPVFFLALDTLVLFLALLYVAMLQEGILAGVLLALAALAVGPAAALSFYFVYREQIVSAQKAE